MSISLSKQTAQEIVDTVKDVCGHNINFINPKGVIFASTDSSRIGDFHEIGKKVADTGKTIEVDSNDSFYGTQKGVNIPFTYNREIIAVIGISGELDEVRQYAVLAQKITSLILREQEIDNFNFGKKNQLNYIIRALIENTEINHDYLMDVLTEHNIDMAVQYRTILIKLNSRYNLSNISMVENHIYQTFDHISAKLYTFNFPNEYVLILPDKQFDNCSYIFSSLANKYKQILNIGIGSASPLSKQHHSYSSAQITIHSLSSNTNIALFDDLDLEILLGSISDNVKNTFLQKTISSLSQEDLAVLKLYFSTDMSLKETAEQLFLHKNTLQYKLNRIERLTGYNPRRFKDAVILHLAVKLMT